MVSLNVTTVGFVAVIGLVAWQVILRLRKRSPYPLPPGPPGEPLLGHLRIIPFEDPASQYARWGKEYQSDVLYFNTLGTPFIVLNSLKSAVDLLDKRGANYSDRPRFVLFEVMGWGMTLTWLRWSPKMQQHRKILQAPFTKQKVGQYHGLQMKEAHTAIKTIMQKPMRWDKALRRFAVAVVLNIGFGVEIKSDDDPYIKIADDAAYAIGNSGAPASSIVDRFPAARYLPDWLPFMERLKFANTWRWAIETIHDVPFAEALRRTKDGTAKPCFAQDRLDIYNRNLEKGQPNDFTLADIKGAAGAIYIAGNDTTLTTVNLFVLFMMENPEIQKKGQAEVDAVVGSDRLPEFDDIPNLPYLNYILQELYRVNPLSPLGIPHRALEDDLYNDMFIPKGTIIYQNVWAMSHDEIIYSDVHTFNPDRFIPKEQGGKGEPFPVGNFGFGRRVCLGRGLAENSLFILLSTMLATLDIGYPLGPDGKQKPIKVEWSYKGQAHPLPFECLMKVRSKQAEDMILNST